MSKSWRFSLLCLIFLARSFAQQPIQARQLSRSDITHVATALDHLTVLEFGEPVTMAAAGSSAFQIERHDSRVFVKPLKPGVSTNLFVWTASARYNYELDPPGEVKTMNFAVDNAIAPPKPAVDSAGQMAQVADLLLTRALLGSERVDRSSVKLNKDGITVRVERVLRTRNGLYIHYQVENWGGEPYRVSTPAVYRLKPNHSEISLVNFPNVQLGSGLVSKLGKTEQRSVQVAHGEVQHEDIHAGEEAQGVVVVREQLDGPVAIQLAFGAYKGRPVLVTLVL